MHTHVYEVLWLYSLIILSHYSPSPLKLLLLSNKSHFSYIYILFLWPTAFNRVSSMSMDLGRAIIGEMTTAYEYYTTEEYDFAYPSNHQHSLGAQIGFCALTLIECLKVQSCACGHTFVFHECNIYVISRRLHLFIFVSLYFVWLLSFDSSLTTVFLLSKTVTHLLPFSFWF